MILQSFLGCLNIDHQYLGSYTADGVYGKYHKADAKKTTRNLIEPIIVENDETSMRRRSLVGTSPEMPSSVQGSDRFP
jgi:hypothetical protein